MHTFKIWPDPGIISWSSPHQLIQEIGRRHGFGGWSCCCFSFFRGCQAVWVERKRFLVHIPYREGFGVQKQSSQHLIPAVRQDGYPCEFLMKLVSANLFAQPKHLWIQNPSCHQSSGEMMSGENPFVSSGIAPWHAAKLQIWTLALSSTGKMHSEISLGQQFLLNYMANSKEHIWYSDSPIFPKAGRIRAIWNSRLKWVSCDCIAAAEPVGL